MLLLCRWSAHLTYQVSCLQACKHLQARKHLFRHVYDLDVLFSATCVQEQLRNLFKYNVMIKRMAIYYIILKVEISKAFAFCICKYISMYEHHITQLELIIFPINQLIFCSKLSKITASFLKSGVTSSNTNILSLLSHKTKKKSSQFSSAADPLHSTSLSACAAPLLYTAAHHSGFITKLLLPQSFQATTEFQYRAYWKSTDQSLPFSNL